MKKQWIYQAILIATLGMTTACGDDEATEPAPPPETPPVASMETAQQEIENVGKELAARIDVQRLQPILSLAEYCERTFLSKDAELTPGNGNMPEPDYPFSSLMRAMHSCAQGDIALLASKRAIGDIYQLNDLYGTWTWDEQDKQWNQSDEPGISADAAIFRFNDENGNKCVVKLKGEGKEFTLARTDSTGYIYSDVIKVPEKTTGTVTVAGEILATLTVNTTACDYAGKNYAAEAVFETCGYRITASVSDNNRQGEIRGSFSDGSTTLLSMEGKINGNALADIGLMEDGYFDAASNVKNGTVACNVLGRISLNITADNSSGALADALDYDGYYWYLANDTVNWQEVARQGAEAAASAANQYTQAAIYFSNSSYSVPVTWQPVLYDYSYPGSMYLNGEWSVEPVLNFENGTTYSFDQYFTQARFQSVLDAFGQLVQNIENIF